MVEFFEFLRNTPHFYGFTSQSSRLVVFANFGRGGENNPNDVKSKIFPSSSDLVNGLPLVNSLKNIYFNQQTIIILFHGN